jgi:ADP-ribosylarginine hydrolase
LGGVATALFTSYAIQSKPVEEWGAKFLDDLDFAKKWIVKSDFHVKENLDNW